ncbi:BrnT family toxin [Planktotalea arctica]|uniref:BrnT family toxin n=1 Tax=Planktotalea arctica TaxID=1481893 RepID=UPI003D2F7138
MWTTALTREDNRVEYGERRFISIGLIGDRHFVVVWTQRDDALRLISLRKANKREVNIHDIG